MNAFGEIGLGDIWFTISVGFQKAIVASSWPTVEGDIKDFCSNTNYCTPSLPSVPTLERVLGLEIWSKTANKGGLRILLTRSPLLSTKTVHSKI